MRKTNKQRKIAGLCLSALLAAASAASAATATWTGSGDGANWSDVNNWDILIAPGTADEVIIDSSDDIAFDVSGNMERRTDTTLGGDASLTLSGKRFLNSREDSCTFTIKDNATLNTSGDYFIVGTNRPGIVNQEGGTVNIAVNRGFFVCDNGSSAGSEYNLTGGTLNARMVASGDDWFNEFLGRNNVESTFYINGGDANFSVDPATLDRRIYIKAGSTLQLDSGSATFNGFKWFSVGRDSELESQLIINGGVMTINTRDDGAMVVGGQNAQGKVTVNEGVLAINSARGLWVGDGTNCIKGSFEQFGGDVRVSTDVILAPASTAIGSYYMMDGGSLSARDILLSENADPSVKFIFNGGEIFLSGDKTTLVNETWFEAAAGTMVDYDAESDSTHIFRIAYAHNPSPANGETGVGTPVGLSNLETVMSWNTGLIIDPNSTPGNPNPEITAHELYMATASDPNMYLVETISAGNPVSVSGSYTISTLSYDEVYTWKVVEVTADGTIDGPKWSFSTPVAIPVITDITPVKEYVEAGMPVTIAAGYQSVSPITAVTWYQDGVAIDPVSDENLTAVITDTQCSLTVDAMADGYDGEFTCMLANAGGDSLVSDIAYVEMYKMVAGYTFDNTIESSTGDFDGYMATTPTYVEGKINEAISFNGVDEYVSTGLSIRDDMTIELWVKTEAVGNAGNWYNGLGLIDAEVAGAKQDFGSSVTDGKFCFGIGNSDTSVASVNNINDGEWHFCVATRNAASGEMKIYVDGELENSANGPTGTKADSANIVMGVIQGSENYLTGAIDEVKLYNYVMSDLDIAITYYDITGEEVCVDSARPSLTYDINNDCKVDIQDFALLGANWLKSGLYPNIQE